MVLAFPLEDLARAALILSGPLFPGRSAEDLGLTRIQFMEAHLAGQLKIPRYLHHIGLRTPSGTGKSETAGGSLQLSVCRCILNDIPGWRAAEGAKWNIRSPVLLLALATQLAPQTSAPAANTGLDWLIGLD